MSDKRPFFNTLLLFVLLLLSACGQRQEAGHALVPVVVPQPDPDLLARLNVPDDTGYLSDYLVTDEVLRFTVTEQLEIVNQGPGETSKHNLWVALVRTIAPYQRVVNVAITPTDYTLVTDEYNNLYAEFDIKDLGAGERRWVKIVYEIEVSRVHYAWDLCEGAVLTAYTGPELRIESNNGQIVSLAEGLASSEATPCEQARAFYDYVGDELVYTYNARDWGAQAALGDMGSDCTEYASLFIALCRAVGIPARYVEGLNYRGIYDDVEARLEHSWTEVYLPGVGWVPVDPTLGRLATTRERYFGEMPADHIIVTVGRTPSTLRGNHYFAHLYWGSGETTIKVENYDWVIEVIDK